MASTPEILHGAHRMRRHQSAISPNVDKNWRGAKTVQTRVAMDLARPHRTPAFRQSLGYPLTPI